MILSYIYIPIQLLKIEIITTELLLLSTMCNKSMNFANISVGETIEREFDGLI